MFEVAVAFAACALCFAAGFVIGHSLKIHRVVERDIDRIARRSAYKMEPVEIRGHRVSPSDVTIDGAKAAPVEPEPDAMRTRHWRQGRKKTV